MAKPSSQISSIDDAPDDGAVAASAVDAEVLVGANIDGNMSGKFELVTVHSSSEDGGTDAVFVSHNGYAYQIPRDKPYKVPFEVAQILRDAKVTVYKPAGNGGDVREETRSRYAFSTVAA